MKDQTLHIIKVGGNIIDDEIKLQAFLRSFASFKGSNLRNIVLYSSSVFVILIEKVDI